MKTSNQFYGNFTKASKCLLLLSPLRNQQAKLDKLSNYFSETIYEQKPDKKANKEHLKIYKCSIVYKTNANLEFI